MEDRSSIRPGWYRSDAWWWPHWGQLQGVGVVVREWPRYEARVQGKAKRFWRLASAMQWVEQNGP